MKVISFIIYTKFIKNKDKYRFVFFMKDNNGVYNLCPKIYHFDLFVDVANKQNVIQKYKNNYIFIHNHTNNIKYNKFLIVKSDFDTKILYKLESEILKQDKWIYKLYFLLIGQFL